MKPTGRSATVTFTEDELLLLSNALNELCHGLRMDDDELRIRTGFTRDEIRALLDRIQRELPSGVRAAGGAEAAVADGGAGGE
jgi:hypothetical protein